MSSSQINQNSNQLDTGFGFPKFGLSIREYWRALIQPISMLKSVGIGLPNDNVLVTSLVKSKLLNINEVKDFESVKQNDSLNLFAYIDQPNEDVENRIYELYSQILELFPKIDVDLRIIELYGRTKQEVQSQSMCEV
jgi:hypothetical protein